MPLKLKPRETVLLGALVVAVTFLSLWGLRHPGTAPLPLALPRSSAPLESVPRIDLARLDRPRVENEAGRRDLFAFGPPEQPAGASPATPTTTPPPAAASPGGLAPGADPAAALAAASATRLPPLNLKYIGSVASASGVKVVVLVTDRNEVLTGQAGQVVANRYRIARIGLESVDLEDIGSGQSRRIPLKGN